MKKKQLKNFSGFLMIRKSKLFLTMRLTLFLLLTMIQGFALNMNAQNSRLTLKMENTTIKTILNDIEEKTDYFFLYNSKLIDVEQKVTIHVENQGITTVLDQLFTGSNISYEIADRQILLSRDRNLTGQPRQITVTGLVQDAQGIPLPGVSVVVKGTTTGVITDNNGNFSLHNTPDNCTLAFSFVGMRTQELNLAGRTNLNITMEEETIGIEEVVAVGYGTIKKQAVTGSVSQANLEVYKDVPTNNILETIKGSVAGLNISGTSKAGAVGSLDIRGQNTIGAANTPLIIVDGAIFNGSLGDIPSDDIEDFTVLKDASAAAVYGSRSANGVILIETKKGNGINGKPKFDVKLSTGISNEMKRLEVYGPDGYLQKLLDYREANGLEADQNNIRIYLQEEELKNYDATSDHKPTLTDPYGLIRQLGYNVNSTVSVSNKTAKTSYYISTNLIKQQGVIINDDYKHISARVNISSDLTDWFNLGIKSYYSLRDYSGSSPDEGSEMNITFFSPWASVYNEDGSYKQFPQTTTSFNSPFWYIATEDQERYNNLNGIVSGIIKIPWIKGLTYTTTYSNTLEWRENFTFYDENTVDGKGKNGMGERIYSRTYNMLFDNLIKYNRTFADKHNIDLTLLYSREHSSWESIDAYAEDFDNTVLGSYALENGGTQTTSTGGGETDGIGMMARGTYSFDNKYTLTGTVRRDGYSAFSKNKKWGVFPSVGFNWNVTRENFMKSVRAIDNLALRVSYGTNGNQSIDAYSTLAKIATDKYLFYGNSSYSVTQYISSLANDDLSWESTTGLNLGIDFAVLEGRIRGSVDGYNTKTNDLMFDLSLPTTSGMSSIKSNIGEIRNRGLEINLRTLNMDKRQFKWYSDFAFSLNRNKIVTLLGEDNDGDGKEDDLISDGYFIGKSLGTIYAYRVIGMWQQENEDNGTIMTGMRPGDYKLEDVNNDGAITSDKDRKFLGNKNPNFRWSWTNTFQYKDFSLMMYFYSIWGGNGWYLSTSNAPYNDGYVNRGDINHPVYDYWTPTHTDAKFPRMDYKGNAAYTGTKNIDRSFIKLQKVSLSYNMNQLVKPMGLNGLSLVLSADNLFTYAPYWYGLDPETNSGLTSGSIPSIRTYTLSVSLDF